MNVYLFVCFFVASETTAPCSIKYISLTGLSILSVEAELA